MKVDCLPRQARGELIRNVLDIVQLWNETRRDVTKRNETQCKRKRCMFCACSNATHLSHATVQHELIPGAEKHIYLLPLLMPDAKNDHLSKTGSGQAWETLKREMHFSQVTTCSSLCLTATSRTAGTNRPPGRPHLFLQPEFRAGTDRLPRQARDQQTH